MPKLEPIPFVPEPNGGFKNYINWLKYTKKWILLEDWYFTLPNGVIVMISANFTFDGASIPKLFRFILSPTGPLFIPSLLHDYGYRYDCFIGVRFDENGNEELYEYKKDVGKKYWDAIFREVSNKLNKLKAVNFFAWLAVHLFGFIAWSGHKKNKCPSLYFT